jgi:hypothetical protein
MSVNTTEMFRDRSRDSVLVSPLTDEATVVSDILSNGCHCEWIWLNILSDIVLCEHRLKCGSIRKCQRKFCYERSVITIRNTGESINLIH